MFLKPRNNGFHFTGQAMHPVLIARLPQRSLRRLLLPVRVAIGSGGNFALIKWRQNVH